jgi:signal transduction histidine kinase
MKKNYDVSRLIKLIKTLPIVIIVLFSFITTYLVLNNSMEKHEQNIKNIKSEFIANQKIIIKQEVLRTIKQINYQKSIAEEKLKEDIKSRVNNVSNVIDNIYKENKSKSKEEITQLIKDAIRVLRYSDGRGYFFIYTLTGTNILYPTSPESEGKNLWNEEDAEGGHSIQVLSKIAKTKGEGFSSWQWYRPSEEKLTNKKMYKKIGYVKHVKELDWFVGTGEYIDDFEKEIQKDLIKEIQEIRFGKNGYIFVVNFDGIILANINKSLIGKNQSYIKESEQKKLFNKMQKVAVEGGYVEYDNMLNPSTNLPEKKISYVAIMDEWQWQIGAGAYLDDIEKVIINKEKEFQEKFYSSIVTIIIWGIIFTVILIYLMLKLLKVVEQEFAKYEKSLSEQIDENHKKDVILAEQSKLAAMGEMIANIAHQWRQPLSVISTAATGMKMQKEYACLPDDIFNNTCDAINNNAQYLSNTIDDFKNFIKGDIRTKEFDLNKVIQSFLNLIDGSLKSHEIKVVLDLEKNIRVNGHANELIQCFMNIFNNAKDALEQNVKKDKQISISTKKVDDKVQIDIQDNAGGIKDNILPHIFEPYFTTKHKSQGTGLGLNMTYKLVVEGMSGKIEASTVEYHDKINHNAKGALFTIILPIKYK